MRGKKTKKKNKHPSLIECCSPFSAVTVRIQLGHVCWNLGWFVLLRL